MYFHRLDDVGTRSVAHWAMGMLRRVQNRLAEARIEFETATALDRNSRSFAQLGFVLMYLGQPEAAIPDAHRIFRQIDRAHRDFTPAQIEFLANIVRLWRGTDPFLTEGSMPDIERHFPDYRYRDVPGLCQRANRKEIEIRGWSLNPGRYVAPAPGESDNQDFRERLEELQEELERLNGEATLLQSRIAQNVAELLA
jgi:hypothetical protein